VGSRAGGCGVWGWGVREVGVLLEGCEASLVVGTAVGFLLAGGLDSVGWEVSGEVGVEVEGRGLGGGRRTGCRLVRRCR